VVQLQVLVGIAVAVLCATLGMSVYQHGRAHAVHEAQQLRPVQAKVVGHPYPAGIGGEMAQVSWTDADGKAHLGVAGVPPADRVGDQVEIWLDTTGNVASAPASTQDIVATAVLTGMLAMIGAEVVVICAGAFARSRLSRWDERAWEAEWRVYEPLWTRRR
jgi:hypothetical protein